MFSVYISCCKYNVSEMNRRKITFLNCNTYLLNHRSSRNKSLSHIERIHLYETTHFIPIQSQPIKVLSVLFVDVNHAACGLEQHIPISKLSIRCKCRHCIHHCRKSESNMEVPFTLVRTSWKWFREIKT